MCLDSKCVPTLRLKRLRVCHIRFHVDENINQEEEKGPTSPALIFVLKHHITSFQCGRRFVWRQHCGCHFEMDIVVYITYWNKYSTSETLQLLLFIIGNLCWKKLVNPTWEPAALHPFISLLKSDEKCIFETNPSTHCVFINRDF